MRIVHITNHFLPSSGGVEWSVLRTAEALSARGHDVTVVTETPADSWDDAVWPFRTLRFTVPIVRPVTRLLYWRWMWEHRKLFRSADVLHFHDYTVFIHWFLPLRALILKPGYAVTFHGFEHWPVRTRHQVFRCITARLCGARFAVGSYVKELYRHPVDDVYLGAPVRLLEEIPRSADMNFTYIGRLAHDTHILPFARALAEAARQGSGKVCLDVAGDGPLRHEILILAHPAFEIRLHGMLEDPTPLLRNARYIIATGFLGILEAFQTGIPVIIPAFNDIKRRYIESIPDIEQMATVLHSEECVSSLQAFLDNSSEQSEVQRAHSASLFVSEHTWDDIAEMLESWYKRIA
jgi:glycosyltransferase involved in cell wall biosynthesis